MLKKFLIIFYFVCSTLNIFSQQAWLPQNSNTTNNLYTVFFIDTLSGFAAGQNGTIINTTNGGINWISHSSLFPGNFNNIYFFNSMTGIVIGDNGKIYKTTNGGNNWVSKISPVSYNLYGMTFLNSNKGFICGASGAILTTINSGENWSVISSGVTSDLRCVCFSNAATGWIAGGAGKIIESTNAGTSWVVNVDLGSLYNFCSINFINNSTGWAGGTIIDYSGNKTGIVYKTTVAGSWWVFQLCDIHQHLNFSFFQNENLGWVVADSGKIAGTINGGDNWIGQPIMQNNNLYSIYFPTSPVGWITGANGLVLRSSRRGYFDTLNTNRRDIGVLPIVINNSQLLDAVYRVIFRAPDTSYNIMRSLNSGASFDTIYSHLHFTDTGKAFDGLLVRVYRIKMNEISPPGTDTGNCGVVKDPTQAAYIGQTINYGWDYSPPQNQYLEGSKYIFFRPMNSISMNLTYPNKTTWTGFKSLINPEDLRKVQIVFTGYGNGEQAYRYLAEYDSNSQLINFVYKNMAEVPLKVYEVEPTDSTPNPRQLNCAFLEFDTSMGGHPDGMWDPTADSLGGREILYIFNSNYSSVPNSFYTTKDLLFNQPQIDVMYVWAPKLISANMNYHVGDVFTIYPYTVTRPDICPGYPLYYEFSTQNLIGIKKISTEVPTKIYLSQNYPNPFNPTTKIKFQAPLSPPEGGMQIVSLEVYDLLGRKITTLFSSPWGRIGGATYEVTWPASIGDASKYASGVYFYKLTIGDYSESRKMILLK